VTERLRTLLPLALFLFINIGGAWIIVVTTPQKYKITNVRRLVWLAFFLNLADWATTMVGIRFFGAIEANPMLSPLMHETSAGIPFHFVKLIIGSMLLVRITRADYTHFSFRRKVVWKGDFTFIPLGVIMALGTISALNIVTMVRIAASRS